MIARLFYRKLVQIESTSSSFDVAGFLNSLVTNKVTLSRKEKSGNPADNSDNSDNSDTSDNSSQIMSAAFLSPQGRVLLDTMIYRDPKNFVQNGYLLEADSTMVSILQSHLKKYILRSPIKVSLRDDLQVVHEWNPLFNLRNQGDLESVKIDGISFIDPRHSLLGSRKILHSGAITTTDREKELIEVRKYLSHRIDVGVGEGPDDFLYNSSLPLEMNLDLTNGVDFRKGCYLGQELTHRTKHLGVIRKRLVILKALPSHFPESLDPATRIIPANTQLFLRGDRLDPKRKSVGRTGSSVGFTGLGVVKLDHVILAGEKTEYDFENYHLETEEGIPVVAYSSKVTQSELHKRWNKETKD